MFLDVIAGPIYAELALIFLLPILAVVTVVMLIVRWIKNKDNKDKDTDAKEENHHVS